MSRTRKSVESSSVKGGTDVGRQTLLVVDDDPVIRRFFRLLFEDRFYVVEASSGSRALEVLRSRWVDVVLLDILMPGLDGLQVLDAIRTIGSLAKVVVVSAISHADTAIAAIQRGAIDYVTKPFDLHHLRLVVERAAALAGKPWVLLCSADLGRRAVLRVALDVRFAVKAAGSIDAAARFIQAENPIAVVLDSTMAETDERTSELPISEWSVPAIITGTPGKCLSRGGRRTSLIYHRSFDLIGLVKSVQALIRSDRTHDLDPIGTCVAEGVKYVAERYRHATVEEIATAVGRSPERLLKLFRAQLGMGVKEYLTRVRVDVATTLLCEGRDKVRGVARQAGFYDASHLSRVLRRRLGRGPGSLRAS